MFCRGSARRPLTAAYVRVAAATEFHDNIGLKSTKQLVPRASSRRLYQPRTSVPTD